MSLISEERSLDIASSVKQNLYDIWKAISHLIYVYSKNKIMRIGTRNQFTVKIVKIKIATMIREAGISLVELFLLSILKICINRKDAFGKDKIERMLEKRWLPDTIFFRMANEMHKNNRT